MQSFMHIRGLLFIHEHKMTSSSPPNRCSKLITKYENWQTLSSSISYSRKTLFLHYMFYSPVWVYCKDNAFVCTKLITFYICKWVLVEILALLLEKYFWLFANPPTTIFIHSSRNISFTFLQKTLKYILYVSFCRKTVHVVIDCSHKFLSNKE